MDSVLILCTGNSCRSQMAEALWKARAEGAWQVSSAGSRPTEHLHPVAIAVLAEEGLDLQGARSKSVEEFSDDEFDVVITVCDDARESCPSIPRARLDLHWSFPDPAAATGSEDDRLALFRRVRDDIRRRIEQFLVDFESSKVFRRWMRQSLEQGLPELAAPEEERYRALIEITARLIPEGPQIWKRLPTEIQRLFTSRGWEWNGFYAREDDILSQVSAAGPPVCATLERKGGLGSSGMCFDALLMNQTLVAQDVSRWPGYVSCDGESGLSTQAGLVCPVRNDQGEPIAVWDLDSTRPLEASDAFFFDRFFATLSVLLEPQALR